MKEFGAGQQVVEEIADYFELSEPHRTAALETVYRKQNRLKKHFSGIDCFFALLTHSQMKDLFRDRRKHFN